MHTPKEVLTILLAAYGHVMSQTHYRMVDEVLMAMPDTGQDTSTGAMGVTLQHLKPFDTVLIPVTDKPVLDEKLIPIGTKVLCNGDQDEVTDHVQQGTENYMQGYRYVLKVHGTQSARTVSRVQKSIWDEEIIAG